MHHRQADEAADHRFVVDRVEMIKRAQFARVDLAGRGRALIVKCTVSEKRPARWTKYARGDAGVAHRDGNQFSAVVASTIEQVEDANAIDDVIGLDRNLQHSGGRACETLVDLFEIVGNAGEVVM